MAEPNDYKAKRATALTNPTAATTFKTVDSATTPAAVYVPAGARAFYLRAMGSVAGGTTTNFTPKIQIGTSATAASNSDFFSGGAVGYNSSNGYYLMEVLCNADQTNSTVNGVGWGSNGPTGAAISAAAATQATGIDVTVSGVGFVVTGLFSATGATNSCTLDSFTLEVLN